MICYPIKKNFIISCTTNIKRPTADRNKIRLADRKKTRLVDTEKLKPANKRKTRLAKAEKLAVDAKVLTDAKSFFVIYYKHQY